MPFASTVGGFQSAWLVETVDPKNWLVLGGTAVLGSAVETAFFRWELAERENLCAAGAGLPIKYRRSVSNQMRRVMAFVVG